MAEDLEAKVLEKVDQEELLDLAKSLVRIPSFFGEETEAAKFVADYLSQRGYKVDLQEVEPGWFQTVATLKGSGGGRSIMFNGHLDIEPLAEGLTRDPFDPWVEDNKLYGAGIRNMKSGVSSMIHAAEAIRKSGIKLSGDIVIATVLGECWGGVGTKHLLDKGYRADVGVVTEPYGAHRVVTKHGGMSGYSLHVFGRHPQGDDLEGVDAIPKMMKAIDAIYNMKMTYAPWVLPGLPWIKVGSIIGGRGKSHDLRAHFRNSDYCTALIHVTTVPGQTTETVREDIENALNALQREDPDFKYELNHPPEREFKAWMMDFPPTDVPNEEEIVQTIVSRYKQVTGREPEAVGPALPIGARYGDDDSHLWQAGIPCCIYGPAGEAYGLDFTYIDQMVLCSQVLALTALHFCA
ncbi:MAG: M20 family metallopeptidase [Dehalococcoidia bacterium]